MASEKVRDRAKSKFSNAINKIDSHLLQSDKLSYVLRQIADNGGIDIGKFYIF